MFVITSTDNPTEQLETTEQIVKLSGFWNEMFDEESEPEPETELTIEIPSGLKTKNLTKVLEFCKLYNADPFGEIQKPLHSNDLTEHGVPKWGTVFLESMDLQTLHDIILSANFLDLQPLLQLCCAYSATLVRGKVPEEIKETWKDVKSNNGI